MMRFTLGVFFCCLCLTQATTVEKMKAAIDQGMVIAEFIGEGQGPAGGDFDPNWAPKTYRYTPDLDGCPWGTAHTVFKTVTGDYGYENTWEILNVGPHCNGAHFVSHFVKEIRCCLPLGPQNIRCIDDNGDGWGNGYVEIDGKKHCDKFKDGAFKTESFNVGAECFDTEITIKTADDGLDNSWMLSGCKGGPYNSNSLYKENCCIMQGVYSLSCVDAKGDGWQGGYLEINGERYCDHFYSGTRFVRKVTIYPQIENGQKEGKVEPALPKLPPAPKHQVNVAAVTKKVLTKKIHKPVKVLASNEKSKEKVKLVSSSNTVTKHGVVQYSKEKKA